MARARTIPLLVRSLVALALLALPPAPAAAESGRARGGDRARGSRDERRHHGAGGRCAVSDEGDERWPDWDPGDRWSDAVQRARAEHAARGYDWRIFHAPYYFAGGDYLSFSTGRNIADGPDTRLDAYGVPQFLGADRAYHDNPVQLAQFALHLHGLHLRGRPVPGAFWVAVDRLLATQDGTGAFRYRFPLGDRPPGFASPMAQGQGLSVLARAYLLRPEPRFLAAGDAAVRFLLVPVSEGGGREDLRALDPSLRRYLFFQEWPAEVPSFTLNGFLFTALGLYDWAALGVATARREPSHAIAAADWACSVQTAARLLRYYDVGGFSTYNLQQIMGISPSPALHPFYQDIHVALMQAFWSLTRRPEFLEFRDRWAAQVGQPAPAP